MMDPHATLTWIGGRAPLPSWLEAIDDVHELIPGGSLVCRCGASHDVPPPSAFVVAVEREVGRARWWRRYPEASSPTSRADAVPQIIPGIVGAREEAALALHLNSIGHGRMFGEDLVETSSVFAAAPQVDFELWEAPSPRDVFAAVESAMAARRTVASARALFVGDFRLCATVEFVRRVLVARATDLILQGGWWDCTPAQLSILSARLCS